jgi:hypothetical protein
MGCGYLTRSCRPRTRVLVSWSKMSVQPHVEVWDSCRLTNSLRAIHELPSSGVPFGIHIKNVLKNEMEEEVRHTGTWPRLAEADHLVNQPWLTTNGSFRIREWPSCDGGLKPFGVAHGIGLREVKVVGNHHSAKILHEGPGDGRRMWVKLCTPADGRRVWVKLCTPAGLNLFEKPCPQLRKTWRQMLDHR